MSNLSYVISALPLLVKPGTKEMKTNKTARICTAFSVHRPICACALREQTGAFQAFGLNLKFEKQSPAEHGSNEIKSCLRTLITFDRSLLYIFWLQPSQSLRNRSFQHTTYIPLLGPETVTQTTPQGENTQKSPQAYFLPPHSLLCF